MANFFEKLKKGMGIEQTIERNFDEEEMEKPIERKAIKRARKARIKAVLKENEPSGEIKIKRAELEVPPAPKEPREEPPLVSEEINLMKKEEIEEKPSLVKLAAAKEKWSNFGQEQVGQLAIDVYQTENDLVIQSAIAGVKPETLDVLMEKDIIAIKGAREKPFEETGDYFSQECYWGSFSREVILPVEVDPNKALAELKDGILTIRIPKLLREKKRKIVVRGS